jgi:hypothetical protein
LSYIIPRSPIEDILAYAEEEESDKELLQSFLAPERYKELLSKIDLQEEGKTNYAKVSEFLTDEERWKIEEYDAERRYESEGADGCHCYAYNSIKAPNGKNPLKRLTAKNSGVCRRRWHLHRIENAI